MAAMMIEASPKPAAGLDPYGQLIRMLMPRAHTIAIYDRAATTLWLSDGQDDPDLQRLAAEALDGRAGSALDIDGSSRAFDGATAYVFRLCDEQGVPLAAVALLARETGESRPFTLVLGLVRPALECLQRELAMRASLGVLTADLSARDRDLDLLLDASFAAEGSRESDDLGRLVQAAVDHLACALGALIVPEKGVAVVRPHRDATRAAEASIVSKTHRHLLNWAQLQQKPLVVNRPGASDRLPPYKLLSVPVRNAAGRVNGFFALFSVPAVEDFGVRHTRLAELLARKAATILQTQFDSGTGLPTRAAFEQSVAALLAGRTARFQDSVLYVDLDRLHVVNENFGMHVGDEVIARVAEVVRRRLPVGALPARVSGDCFAAYLPDTDTDRAARIAEELRAAVAELSQTRPDGALRVSVSIGVAALAGNSRHPLQHALASAEIACKAAKDRGRDRVESFLDTDQSIVRRQTDVHAVATMRDALAAGRLRLYAQPILPLSPGRREPRFEVLLRLESANGEMLPPSKFLPAAERYQLIAEIDRWVVANALRALGAHRGLLQRGVARFSINLSGQSVTDLQTAEFVAAQVKDSGVPADVICFELTETAAVANVEKADAFMQRLRSVGCSFALDDFGTGTSSLAYLKSLPVSMLKIDGSFVRDAMTNARSDSLVKAIAQLARSMGIATVAEYVETDELRMRMASLGVDYGQGFAIGKPLPFAEVLQELSIYEALAAETALGGGEDLLPPDLLTGGTPRLAG
jgi:diguanylate cyclase (GGDEF)-like protein